VVAYYGQYEQAVDTPETEEAVEQEPAASFGEEVPDGDVVEHVAVKLEEPAGHDHPAEQSEPTPSDTMEDAGGKVGDQDSSH
jgi:hypothetical protein